MILLTALCLFGGKSPPPVVGLAAAFFPVAQLPDPRSHGAVGWVLVVLFIIVGAAGMIPAAINGWRSLFAKTPPQQAHRIEQPVRISAEVIYAEKAEMHQLRDEFEQFKGEWLTNNVDLREKIDDKFEDATKAQLSSAGKIHARIDSLAEKQGVLVGESKQINANVRMLLERMGGAKK